MDGLSIIIPAHNEASVIESTLRSVLASTLDRKLQIIVVANGCTDDTAERARSIGGPIEVVETPVGNKANALNLGDRAAKYFPRVYLDADIRLSTNALQAVCDAFKDPECRIAAPTVRYNYGGGNPFLAGYYKLWRSLPYVRKAIMGSGFYALDYVLRHRFDQFPAITADDKFIRNLTSPSERRVVSGCFATIQMPETLTDLLKVKTRWTYGNLELAAARPDLNVNDRDHWEGAITHVLARPWLWIHVPLFLFVYLYTHNLAQKRFAERRAIWDRDGTTRPLPTPTRQTRPAA